MMGIDGGPRRPPNPLSCYLGCGSLELEDFLEVLVRRAVVHPRQRLALTGSALSRAGHAIALLAIQSHIGGQCVEELLDLLDVTLDDHVDTNLLGEREVLPNLREQRLRRPGEVPPIGDQALNGALARLEQLLPGRKRPFQAPRPVKPGSEVPIDGTAELIHPDLSLPPEFVSQASCPRTIRRKLSTSP